MVEQDEYLARLTDLDVTWGFDLHDLHAFLRERSQETPVAVDAGDGTAEMMGSSQGGEVDASSVPTGRAERVDTNSRCLRQCKSGRSWQHTGKYILDDKRCNVPDGRRTCCGRKYRGVKRVHAEWFSRRVGRILMFFSWLWMAT